MYHLCVFHVERRSVHVLSTSLSVDRSCMHGVSCLIMYPNMSPAAPPNSVLAVLSRPAFYQHSPASRQLRMHRPTKSSQYRLSLAVEGHFCLCTSKQAKGKKYREILISWQLLTYIYIYLPSKFLYKWKSHEVIPLPMQFWCSKYIVSR